MKALDESEFCIIGAGLMGASLALALRGKVKALHGIDPNPAAREPALAIFDHFSVDLRDCASADVIVLAAPINAIVTLLPQIGVLAKRGALILDLGSVKAPVVRSMNELPEHLFAVAGHPMCGKELSGASAAEARIYCDCRFVLCQTARSTAESMALAERIVRAAQARPLWLEAEQHDRAVAAISHLPYLISTALVEAVGSLADHADGDVLWQLASSGFRDTSRLASSDVTMMGDTVFTNRNAILPVLEAALLQLTALREALRHDDDPQLRRFLGAARARRSIWLENYPPPSKA
ncbi:MAG: hypothetical protein OHK0023_19880 [Anaerolineae bacterium]